MYRVGVALCNLGCFTHLPFAARAAYAVRRPAWSPTATTRDWQVQLSESRVLTFDALTLSAPESVVILTFAVDFSSGIPSPEPAFGS